MGRRKERKKTKKRGQENGKGIWEDMFPRKEERWGVFRQEERRRKEWEGGKRGKEKKKRGQENGKGIWEDMCPRGEERWGVLDRRRGEGKNGKEEREEKKRIREDRRLGKVYGRRREVGEFWTGGGEKERLGWRNELKRKEKERTGDGKGIWEGRRGGRVLDRRREEGKNGKEEREEKKRKGEDWRMGKVYGRTCFREGRIGREF
jgi:hypothetical protein